MLAGAPGDMAVMVMVRLSMELGSSFNGSNPEILVDLKHDLHKHTHKHRSTGFRLNPITVIEIQCLDDCDSAALSSSLSFMIHAPHLQPDFHFSSFVFLSSVSLAFVSHRPAMLLCSSWYASELVK